MFCILQEQHNEKLAKCHDSKVGLKLEPNMTLHDDSGQVQYRLAMVVFRTGGLKDGHFYVAAPASHTSWRLFNNNNASPPMSLRALRQEHGAHVHGMVYVRTEKPAGALDEWYKPTGQAEIPVRYTPKYFLALYQPTKQALAVNSQLV